MKEESRGNIKWLKQARERKTAGYHINVAGK
jgi:hypothetical protein